MGPRLSAGSAGRARVVAFGDARKLAENRGDRGDLVFREMLFEQRADRGHVATRRRLELATARVGELRVGDTQVACAGGSLDQPCVLESLEKSRDPRWRQHEAPRELHS